MLPIERFNAKWLPHPRTGCWMWVGARASGVYGSFTLNDRTVQAHRFSWEAHNGPVPDGFHVLHKCDQPVCVNPDHLFLGDHTANMRDRLAKGRYRNGFESRTHCPQGHEYSATNTYTDPEGHRRCRTCKRASDKARRSMDAVTGEKR